MKLAKRIVESATTCAQRWCRWFGHCWEIVSPDDLLRHWAVKRQCRRCGYQEAMYENRFPKIGQPQWEWRASPSQRMKEFGFHRTVPKQADAAKPEGE